MKPDGHYYKHEPKFLSSFLLNLFMEICSKRVCYNRVAVSIFTGCLTYCGQFGWFSWQGLSDIQFWHFFISFCYFIGHPVDIIELASGHYILNLFKQAFVFSASLPNPLPPILNFFYSILCNIFCYCLFCRLCNCFCFSICFKLAHSLCYMAGAEILSF